MAAFLTLSGSLDWFIFTEFESPLELLQTPLAQPIQHSVFLQQFLVFLVAEFIRMGILVGLRFFSSCFRSRVVGLHFRGILLKLGISSERFYHEGV